MNPAYHRINAACLKKIGVRALLFYHESNGNGTVIREVA